MNRTKSLRHYVQALFTPACWICTGSYSRVWDLKLQVLIAENRFKLVDAYTAKLGDVGVWYENHPYGSFSLWEEKPSTSLTPRPSRSTVMFAMEMLLIDLQNKKMSKTKLYTKSKHPNQGLIDCFLRQAKIEDKYAKVYVEQEQLYHLA